MQDDSPTGVEKKYIQTIIGIDSPTLKDQDNNYFVKIERYPYTKCRWIEENKLMRTTPSMLASFKRECMGTKLIDCSKLQLNLFIPPSSHFSEKYLLPRRIVNTSFKGDVKKYLIEYWSHTEHDFVSLPEGEVSTNLVQEYEQWIKKRIPREAIDPSSLPIFSDSEKNDEIFADLLNGCKLNSSQIELIKSIIKSWKKTESIFFIPEYSSKDANQYMETILGALTYISKTYENSGAFLIITTESNTDLWQDAIAKYTDLGFTFLGRTAFSNGKVIINPFKYVNNNTNERTQTQTIKDEIILVPLPFLKYHMNELSTFTFSISIIDYQPQMLWAYHDYIQKINSHFPLVMNYKYTNLEENRNLLKLIDPYNFEIMNNNQNSKTLENSIVTCLQNKYSKMLRICKKVNIFIPLSPHQKDKYIDVIKKNMKFMSKEQVENEKDIEMLVTNQCDFIKNLILNVCNTYEDQDSDEKTINFFLKSTCKIVFLIQFLTQAKTMGKKVIIFVESDNCLDFVFRFLTMAKFKNIKHTKYQTISRKQDQSYYFSTTQEPYILLSNTYENLPQSTNYIIIYENDFKTTSQDDCISKIKNEMTISLSTRGTIEEEFILEKLKETLIPQDISEYIKSSTPQVENYMKNDYGLRKSILTLTNNYKDDDYQDFCIKDIEYIIENYDIENLKSKYIQYNTNQIFSPTFVEDNIINIKSQTVIHTKYLSDSTDNEDETEISSVSIMSIKEAETISQQIVQNGLFDTICGSISQGEDISENYKFCALLYSAWLRLSDTEMQQTAIIKSTIFKCIPLSQELNDLLIRQKPLNDAYFIKHLFIKDPHLTLFQIIQNIIKKDLHFRLISYLTYLLQQNDFFFDLGFDIKSPLWWNSLCDYICIYYPDEQNNIPNIIQSMMPKDIQISEEFCLQKRKLILDKLKKIIPDNYFPKIRPILPQNFYGTSSSTVSPLLSKYANKSANNINQNGSASMMNEELPDNQLKYLLDTLKLIQPEPFDTICKRILENTVLSYREVIIAKYIKYIYQFVKYYPEGVMFTLEFNERIFSAIQRVCTKHESELILENLKFLTFLYKQPPKPDSKSFEATIFNYTRENGFVSLCKIRARFKVLFQNVNVDVLHETRQKEKEKMKPLIPEGVRNEELWKLQNIDVWKQYIQKMLDKSEISFDPPSFMKESSDNILYIHSLGNMNEQGIPIGYRAMRNIQGHIIIMQITSGPIYSIKEYGNGISVDDKQIGSAFSNFLLSFYKKYDIMIEFESLFEFFGLSNEVFQLLVHKQQTKN